VKTVKVKRLLRRVSKKSESSGMKKSQWNTSNMKLHHKEFLRKSFSPFLNGEWFTNNFHRYSGFINMAFRVNL